MAGSEKTVAGPMDLYFREQTDDVKKKLELVAAVAFPGMKCEAHYDRCSDPSVWWFEVEFPGGISRNFYPVHARDGIKGSGVAFLLSEIYP